MHLDPCLFRNGLNCLSAQAEQAHRSKAGGSTAVQTQCAVNCHGCRCRLERELGKRIRRTGHDCGGCERVHGTAARRATQGGVAIRHFLLQVEVELVVIADDEILGKVVGFERSGSRTCVGLADAAVLVGDPVAGAVGQGHG